ncbi:uncharacterized protein LOC128267503 [Anopheles cruzii]|uniref:uncharacterized protein LOC128267503 n=1 Tax=Anopheles cruzii TaxID=68878 RepID=UPI0022EC6CA8|nr:uncharacterized protein LOC128267503 [Anopheles cruzii]
MLSDRNVRHCPSHKTSSPPIMGVTEFRSLWPDSTMVVREKPFATGMDEGKATQATGPAHANSADLRRRRSSGIVENVLNVITKLFSMTTTKSQSVNKTPELETGSEWSDGNDKMGHNTSSAIPIFETTKSGIRQLTVPPDYGSLPEDSNAAIAGVYLQEASPRMEPSTTRTVPMRKRRRQPAHKTHSAPGSESGKGCGGKNRKDKKRHDLRQDIVNDSLALGAEDCYGYEYRGADIDDDSDSVTIGPRYLSSSFSPSSTGSTGSFHDAIQDFSVLAACLRLADGLSEEATTTATKPGTPRTAASVSLVVLNRPSESREHSRLLAKCDNPDPEGGFVMLNEYDVFTTPSASPMRRPRSICTAINSFLTPSHMRRRQSSDETEDDEDDEVGWNSEECSDDGNAPADYDDDDDDDDSVVFCEEYDDNDDTNSSSGFEERKVRFCINPVVHVMRAWDFAYRQARKGEWEMAARDRERFRKHIADLEPVLGPALQPALRDRVYAARFKHDGDGNDNVVATNTLPPAIDG